MIKLHIDPLSKIIYGYSNILKNTMVYADDVVLEDIEAININIGVSKYSDTDGIINPTGDDDADTEFEAFGDNTYRNSIDNIKGELTTLTTEPEHDYFMKLIIDENLDIETAKEMVKTRRERVDELRENLEKVNADKKTAVRNHYLELDREKDAKLNFEYYSAVIMVIKHENRYLKEWLDWHLNIGFDHIWLYDNGTEENVLDVVSTYPEDIQSKITIVDWSDSHTHLQQDAYTHFMENYKEIVRWGIFIDSDEYVKLVDETFTNVNDFLSNYEDYAEIYGYEVEYNANGQETYVDAPLHDRFTKLAEVNEGVFFKNFVQVNRISHWMMHYARYNEDKHFMFKNEESNKDLFVIEHFYTKSWEEWCWKIKERGGADPIYHKSLQEFFYYNPDMEHLNTGEVYYQKYEENLHTAFKQEEAVGTVETTETETAEDSNSAETE